MRAHRNGRFIETNLGIAWASRSYLLRHWTIGTTLHTDKHRSTLLGFVRMCSASANQLEHHQHFGKSWHGRDPGIGLGGASLCIYIHMSAIYCTAPP